MLVAVVVVDLASRHWQASCLMASQTLCQFAAAVVGGSFSDLLFDVTTFPSTRHEISVGELDVNKLVTERGKISSFKQNSIFH